MSKTTASAAGAALPVAQAAPHPDAQIFELAKAAIAMGANRQELSDKLEAVELNLKQIGAPEILKRTEKDRALGLFAGSSVGSPYSHEEIELLRYLRQRFGRSSEIHAAQGYERTTEILKAWQEWRQDVKIEQERTGVAMASEAYLTTADRHDDFLALLAKTPARTIDGVLAKARAFSYYIRADDLLAEDIDSEARDRGTGDELVRLTLTRDIAALARRQEPAQ